MVKKSQNLNVTDSNLKRLVIGSGISIIITIVGLIIFAILLTYTNVSENTIPVVTIVIVVMIDIFCAVTFFYALDIDKFLEMGTIEYYMGMLMLDILMFIVALTIRYFKMTYTNVESGNKDIGIAFNSLLTLLFIFPSISMIMAYVENRPLSIASIVIMLISMLAIVVLSIFNSQKRWRFLAI